MIGKTNIGDSAYALSLEEIEASTGLSGRIPSAQAVKELNNSLHVTTKNDWDATYHSTYQLPSDCLALYLSCSYGYDERMIGIAFKDSTTAKRNYVGSVSATTVTISINWDTLTATISKSGGDYGNVYVFIRPLTARYNA